jgi:iron complex transport system substrate-binding protein
VVRVVSLVPAATDVLSALGVGSCLVGMTDDCQGPPGTPVVVASVLPAGLDQAGIDAIVSARVRAGLPLREVRSDLLRALAPDVVVAQDLCAVCAVGSAEVAEALEMVGSPAVLHTYDPHRLDDLVPAIIELAAACGLGAAAAVLAASLTDRLHALRRRVAGRTPSRVVVLEWTDPLWAAGHWVPDVVAAAGGVEVLGVAGGASMRVDRAAVLSARPDAVVVAPCGLPLADAEEAALTLTSWLPSRTRVLAADGTLLTGAGPGLVDVAEALAGQLEQVLGDGSAHTTAAGGPKSPDLGPTSAKPAGVSG